MITDATENLRASLKRLHRADVKYGVPEDDIKRFLDGGYLTDEHKCTLTAVLFPHLAYDPTHDRFVSRTVTYAILQATAHLRRLVQDYPDKSEISRRAKISFALLDQFALGEKDIPPETKQSLADILGIHRAYDRRTDSLAPLPATSPPLIQPPDTVHRPWREQQVPTMRTVT
ncbi:hypothetical protein JQ543_05055 [Bradyrhizobium diazoefficiens]|nr:hypothetical protein [Bradyrhizobium diazoefficiens]MBR0847109.1 hypothetical protein [Bradyrhizobium diazoefficiens]